MFQIAKKHQKYQKYNPTNIDWIGDIPDEWNKTRLGYQCKIETGSKDVNEGNPDGQYPFFTCSKEPTCSDNYSFDKEALLIAGNGEVGLTKYYNGKFEAYQRTYVLSNFKNYPHFLKHYITTLLPIAMETRQIGSVIGYIKMGDLTHFDIVLPSIDEQKKIADYLDEKTRILDEAITKKKKQIELLAEHRTALINNAITKGLDPDIEMKDSGVEWIGKIPVHWKVKPLYSEIRENKKRNEGNVNSNVLSLSYGKIIRRDVENNFGLLPDSFETYQIVDEGMVIMRLTDLQNDKKSLRVGYVNELGIITSAYVGLISKGGILSSFLYQLLHSYDLQKVFYFLGGGVRQGMNYEDLRRLPLLMPPIEEQKKIADYLDKETKYIDDMIAKIEKSIELLEEYKTSLISHVVSGKIRVS